MNPSQVPPGPLLIDTDVFSWLVWQRGPWERFAKLVDGHPFVLGFPTVAELRSGALIAGWGVKRRMALDEKIRECVVLPGTDSVTTRFAEIHAKFHGHLKGGGVNDMWIAACCLAQPDPLPVVTGNLSDFGRIATAFDLSIVHPDL